jgi:hypothetical protein
MAHQLITFRHVLQKGASAKPSLTMLAMPRGSRVPSSISGLRGLPLLRKVIARNLQCRTCMELLLQRDYLLTCLWIRKYDRSWVGRLPCCSMSMMIYSRATSYMDMKELEYDSHLVWFQEPRTQRRRDLTVATATPLSRQFTSVPGFTQIGEPVRFQRLTSSRLTKVVGDAQCLCLSSLDAKLSAYGLVVPYRSLRASIWAMSWRVCQRR